MLKARYHAAPEDMIALGAVFFSDASLRADIVLLLDFLKTLRSIGQKVTEPQLGTIRLQWWADSLYDQTQAHDPLLRQLRDLIKRRNIASEAMTEFVLAQTRLLEQTPLSLDEARILAKSSEGQILRWAGAFLGLESVPDHALDGFVLACLKRQGRLVELSNADIRAIEIPFTHKIDERLHPLVLCSHLSKAILRDKSFSPLSLRLRLWWAYLFG